MQFATTVVKRDILPPFAGQSQVNQKGQYSNKVSMLAIHRPVEVTKILGSMVNSLQWKLTRVLLFRLSLKRL